MDDEPDVYLSRLGLFGSNRQLPVFPSECKCLMRWKRIFSITLSFSMTIYVTYYFMFSCLTACSSYMDCFIVYVADVVYFNFEGNIHIMCESFDFFLVLKIALHGKFWDTLVQFLGSYGDNCTFLFYHNSLHI